jgi:hypothetical protein
MFEKVFEVDEWRMTAEEGRALLTDDIRGELQQFSDRELLSKGFLVRGRVRPRAITKDLHGSGA